MRFLAVKSIVRRREDDFNSVRDVEIRFYFTATETRIDGRMDVASADRMTTRRRFHIIPRPYASLQQ